MRQHFRTALLTIILAGGTTMSYATAYVMMGKTAAASASVVAPATLPQARALMPAGQTDIPIREVCAGAARRVDGSQCVQAYAAALPVRVIDIAGKSDTLIR